MATIVEYKHNSWSLITERGNLSCLLKPQPNMHSEGAMEDLVSRVNELETIVGQLAELLYEKTPATLEEITQACNIYVDEIKEVAP